MKMYISVRQEVPLGFAVLGAAHASLGAYLRFKEEPEVEEWISGPFYKAVCRVSDEDFERAKDAGRYVLITESALDGAEVALGFCPRDEWPKAFRFFKLFR